MESDQESINSYNSRGESFNQVPQSYVPENQNTASRVNTLRLVPTETAKSLQEMGVSSEAPIPDINAPQNVKSPIFPEEYTMETPTGLVPVATLHSIGRTTSAVSRTRTRQLDRQESSSSFDSSSENQKKKFTGDNDEEQELDTDIEFVTFVTNDPENPHNWATWLR